MSAPTNPQTQTTTNQPSTTALDAAQPPTSEVPQESPSTQAPTTTSTTTALDAAQPPQPTGPPQWMLNLLDINPNLSIDYLKQYFAPIMGLMEGRTQPFTSDEYNRMTPEQRALVPFSFRPKITHDPNYLGAGSGNYLGAGFGQGTIADGAGRPSGNTEFNLNQNLMTGEGINILTNVTPEAAAIQHEEYLTRGITAHDMMSLTEESPEIADAVLLFNFDGTTQHWQDMDPNLRLSFVRASTLLKNSFVDSPEVKQGLTNYFIKNWAQYGTNPEEALAKFKKRVDIERNRDNPSQVLNGWITEGQRLTDVDLIELATQNAMNKTLGSTERTWDDPEKGPEKYSHEWYAANNGTDTPATTTPTGDTMPRAESPYDDVIENAMQTAEEAAQAPIDELDPENAAMKIQQTDLADFAAQLAMGGEGSAARAQYQQGLQDQMLAAQAAAAGQAGIDPALARRMGLQQATEAARGANFEMARLRGDEQKWALEQAANITGQVREQDLQRAIAEANNANTQIAEMNNKYMQAMQLGLGAEQAAQQAIESYRNYLAGLDQASKERQVRILMTHLQGQYGIDQAKAGRPKQQNPLIAGLFGLGSALIGGAATVLAKP